MRWAWVDTGRPIGGPRRASGVDVRQAQPWADHTHSPWCPLLMEQEIKEGGLIRRALPSLFDPCAQTPKGRSRREIEFYWTTVSELACHSSRWHWTGEEGRSTCSSRPSVLTQPRPVADIARLSNLRCSNCFSAGMPI